MAGSTHTQKTKTKYPARPTNVQQPVQPKAHSDGKPTGKGKAGR